MRQQKGAEGGGEACRKAVDCTEAICNSQLGSSAVNTPEVWGCQIVYGTFGDIPDIHGPNSP
jgi:hypothetical protein